MNRLEKKCLIVSGALHLLLFGILLFGAALMPGKLEKPGKPLQLIDLSQLVDTETKGGGPELVSLPAPAPRAVQTIEPTPAPPAPRVDPPKHVEPPKAAVVPPKTAETVKPAVRATPTVPRAEAPKPDKPKPNLTQAERDALKNLVTRSSNDLAQEQQRADADARKRTQADNQKRIAAELKRTMVALKTGVAGPTDIKTLPGDGSGGTPSVNYEDAVRTIYTAAWNPPPDLSDESATVIANVTIDREGHVMRSRITKPSGNAGMDRSIRATLENVTEIGPFPPGAKEQQRSYNIEFNLKAKRSLG